MKINQTEPKIHSKLDRGLTLLELIIAMAILSVAILGLVGVFGNISRALHFSKTKSLAVNLAQERIEALKNVSYYRLLVTTAATTSIEPGIATFQYDEGFYAPEEITVGQIPYERRVHVQKVTETSGNLTVNNWYDNDTGLKLITTHVIWQEGDRWQKYTLTNLRENPSRQSMDASFIGNVRSGGTNLVDANVQILQNQMLAGITDSSGDYSISVPEGAYDLKASKRGYFSKSVSDSVTGSNSKTVNFDLTEMDVGQVQGFAYLNNHILISKVCAAVGGDEFLEYVEFYNPSDLDFNMSDGTLPLYKINFVETATSLLTPINPKLTTRYVNTVIPAQSYYLLASSPSVNLVAADAFYSDAGLVNGVPENRIPIATSGGIAIESTGEYEIVGSTVDAIGWSRGSSPFGPSNAREGNGLRLAGGPGHNGLSAQETIQRVAYSSSTEALMDGIHINIANAYDTDENLTNWVHHSHTGTETPQNSSVVRQPDSGTPAQGAFFFVDDGLSSSAMAVANGSFTVTNIATGTWSIIASSDSWVYTEDSINVTNGATTILGNIFLSSGTTRGFISGRIVNNVNLGIENIEVKASAATDVTDANGYYNMPIDVGMYTVVGNPDAVNSLYTVGLETGVVVNSGSLTIVDDIVIYPGGSLQGFITPDGVNPLPFIPVVALSSSTGAEVGSSITNALGLFSFSNLPTGTYSMVPQLEIGESASPSSLFGTVLSGSTINVGTMTVSNAFGKITGNVTISGAPITTGVLLLAVPQPTNIGSSPPTNNENLRNGSIVYYNGTSGSGGEFIIPVRGGITYNVAAWYTTFSNDTPVVTQKTGTATVSAGGTATLNFAW